MSVFSRIREFVTGLFSRKQPEPTIEVSPPPSPETQTFNDLIGEAIDAGSIIFDKPDINDYLSEYEPEWLEAWAAVPVETMTEGQIRAFIDVLSDMPMEDWPDFGDDAFNYWKWFNEQYGKAAA